MSQKEKQRITPCPLEQRWAEGGQEGAVGRGHTYLRNKREWKRRSRKKRKGERKEAYRKQVRKTAETLLCLVGCQGGKICSELSLRTDLSDFQ